MTERMVVTTVDLGDRGRHQVSFPVRQPGASGLIGYLTTAGGPLVLKVLKVRELLAWSLGERLIEPGYVRTLRQVPLRSSAFAPTVAMRDRVRRNNQVCGDWLRRVDRERAAAALGRLLPPGDRGERLLAEIFTGAGPLHFAPALSAPVDVNFPAPGPHAVPGLLQERISGQPVRLGRGADGRATRQRFLLLLALALDMAHQTGLGLDLTPRVHTRAVSFPNVLTRPGTADLVYVDFFGLAARRGDVIERAGYRLGYGPIGTAFSRYLTRQVLSGMESPG